jgi:hypothetical protein
MPKVSLHMGITYPGAKDYSSFRSDITITDVDTEESIDEQIKKSLDAIAQIGDAAEETLAQQAANASGLAVEGVGLATEFYLFREKDKKWKQKLADKINELIEEKDAAEKKGK